jgi:MFS family permease
MSRQSHLLGKYRFLPLFITQFLGALNDNVLKNALVVLLTFQAASWTTLKPELLANLAAGIFILPFFLFSATAGQLADKYDKARLARLVKVLEILIVLVAGIGFYLHSIQLLMASLFLLGAHSTLFGPIKYAILPQHLREDELVGGNALIEAGTFVAILLGTLMGGLLAGSAGATGWITMAGLIIALAGYLASRSIPAAPAPEPELSINFNFIGETWRNIHFARKTRAVFLSILGISWFWLYGALFLAQFPAFTKNVLGGAESGVTLLLAVFTIGIGAGSLLCERLSDGRIELGLVPFGSIGLTLFGLDLAFASPATPAQHPPLGALALICLPGVWRILADLLLTGVFGGFFIVPLYALVQQRSEASHRARVIAANNIFNALFMVMGATGAALLLASGLSIPMLFATAAVCNAAVALYIYSLLPEFLARFIIWLMIHLMHRLSTQGIEQIPEHEAVLLSYTGSDKATVPLLIAACRRPIRFVIQRAETRNILSRFIFQQSRAIFHDTPKGTGSQLPAAILTEIRAALNANEVVAMPASLVPVNLTANMSHFSVSLTGEQKFFSHIHLRVTNENRN